jgi:hypothetical protein
MTVGPHNPKGEYIVGEITSQEKMTRLGFEPRTP